MFRASFTAITVSVIIMMGSLLVIPAAHGNQGSPQLSTLASFSPIHGLNSSDGANFTLYVPQSAYDIALAQSAINYLGVHPHRFGLLWTFTVPRGVAVEVNSTLEKLTNGSGITFFYSLDGTPVSPSISYTYSGQDVNIPFAFTPAVLSRAYNFTWPLAHGINGTGITIGIVDAYGNPNIMYDMKAFDAVNGLPAVNLTIEYPNGQPGTYNSTWAMETSTDVEWAHALAPAAKIVLLISTSSYTRDLQNIVSYAVAHRVANILSLSWGTPEYGLSSSSELTYSHVYQQAAAEGITVLSASGDNGAYSGGPQLTVDFPASDPFVTGVGGTSLYAFNNRFQQSGWGGILDGQSYGSGGGFSTVFNTPYWQAVQGYNGSRRGVPDIAMDANKYTGVYVISSGGQYIVGGTSVATPIWADVVALIEQYTGFHLPSINPLLYQIARTHLYNSSFTQILTGTNGYYSNSPYWNPVTGLGTPKVAMLLNASRDILDGYGGVAVFNGSRSYNATGISVDLNLSPQQNIMDLNGTTYYYDGFYLNSGNYVEFGVTLNTSGEGLMLIISQDGSRVVTHYQLPPGYSGDLSSFNLEVGLGPSSITVRTSGGFSSTVPAFLSFSGEASPAIGTTQIDSQTNLTTINPGVFSSINVRNGSGAITPQYMYFQHYNYINSTTYSTMDAFASPGQVEFRTSATPETNLIGGTGLPGPEIVYDQNYGSPTLLTFHVRGGPTDALWSVNSSALKGNTYMATAGGSYMVNATFTYSNVQQTLTRIISVPDMHLANVSVNYTISGSSYAGTVITSLMFYNFHYTSPGMKIPALNGTSDAGASAPGFTTESTSFTGDQNWTFRLFPLDVAVSVFVFNANASVTFNNLTGGQSGGFHYRDMAPGQNVFINVSKNGYLNLTEEYFLKPGQNVSIQVDLLPVENGYHPLSGTVSDIIYSFPIENALVMVNSTAASYTNRTGIFYIYPVTGKYNVSAKADMYRNYSTPLNISSATIIDIKMSPAKISVNSGESVSITHYFPLLFYFGFLSWNTYKGKNFSIYQVYVSNNQNFLSPSITTVSSQNTSYTFLTGLLPGSTYYVSVVLRLSNSQVYQSQVVKITYENPVYLGINLVLAGAIGFYIYVGYRVFRKRRNRNEGQ